MGPEIEYNLTLSSHSVTAEIFSFDLVWKLSDQSDKSSFTNQPGMSSFVDSQHDSYDSSTPSDAVLPQASLMYTGPKQPQFIPEASLQGSASHLRLINVVDVFAKS